MSNPPTPPRLSFLSAIGPGLLVAATGVGAGDLATGAFTGSRLGVTVLWAVLVGAFMKFMLTEGLARWQISTGETLLEGVLSRVARPLRWLFLLYLLPWSFFVGSALVSACGVATHALMPNVLGDAETGKVVFGITCSILGLVLVELGGFGLFEKIMRIAIGVMFVTTIAAAALTAGDAWPDIARGLLVPSIPTPLADTETAAGATGTAEALNWTLALIGGVGGTLTILCYGYWIRQAGRDKPEHLGLCRIDLAVGYLVTAVFGIAVVILGSQLKTTGKGASLLVELGDQLESQLEGQLGAPFGAFLAWAFLLGAFGAVFSSLLGVWQSVPYIFADFWRLARRRPGDTLPLEAIDTRSRVYRVFLYALAIVPLWGLQTSFRSVQQAYAILGAAFIPLVALALLLLHGKSGGTGGTFRNRPWTTVLLALAFAGFVWIEIQRRIAS